MAALLTLDQSVRVRILLPQPKRTDTHRVSVLFLFPKGFEPDRLTPQRKQFGELFLGGSREGLVPERAVREAYGESFFRSQKILRSKFLGFFHLCRKAQHRLRGTRNII